MKEKLFILFFISSAVWGNAVDGIALPVLGSLFPLRIAILLFGIILWYRSYVLGDQITVWGTAKSGPRQLRNTTLLAFIAMMIWGVVTLYWAYNKMTAIVELVTWASSFVCIAICLTFLKSQELIVFAARVFIINFLIIGGIGIYESFTGDYYNLTYEYYTRQKNIFDLYRPASIMYNINNLAIFMALSMPVCFVGTEGMKNRTLWDMLLLIYGAFVAVLTGCNTGIIIFCLIFILYLYLNRERGSTALLVIVILSVLLAFSSVVANIFYEIINFSVIDEPRWMLWKNAIGVAWRYGFMGVGPGNSGIVNTVYRTVNLAETARVHNYFLTVFEDFGIFGFAFFVWWFFKLSKSLILSYKKQKTSLAKYGFLFLVIFLPSTVCMSSMIGYFYYWAEIGIFMALNEVLERQTNDLLCES